MWKCTAYYSTESVVCQCISKHAMNTRECCYVIERYQMIKHDALYEKILCAVIQHISTGFQLWIALFSAVEVYIGLCKLGMNVLNIHRV